MSTKEDTELKIASTKTEQDGSSRICRRCLTRDMLGQEEYFVNLQEYIRNIDADVKAEESLYESRLDICKECERLFQGMCRICGCYVELRAAIEGKSCPDKKW